MPGRTRTYIDLGRSVGFELKKRGVTNFREMDGTIWFISLLTRVDGLVLLDRHLAVRGFGVEITYSEEPSNLFLAGNRSGTKAKLKNLDYNHYGTRHRTMM